jgi:hypothetical protein
MATSGSYDWTQSRDNIIERALRMLGALGQGQVATAPQISEGATALNAFVKALSIEPGGPQLWAIEWVTQTFSAASVVAGTDGNDYTCIRSHTSSSDSTPVTGANWSTYWKQTGTGGGVWADATAYSAIGDFTVTADTLGIDQAFIRHNEVDYPVGLITRDKYFSITDKATLAMPTHLWFDRQLTGRVYLYGQPDTTDYVLHYARARKLEDFDASGNNPDFPEEWIELLTVGTASKLAPEYGIPVIERRELRGELKRLKKDAKSHDMEVDDSPFSESAY